MGDRYWISGVHLGMLNTSDAKRRKDIISKILSEQFVGRIEEWEKDKLKVIVAQQNNQTPTTNNQRPLKHNNVVNKSYEVEKDELGSNRTGKITSSGVEDPSPKRDLSSADNPQNARDGNLSVRTRNQSKDSSVDSSRGRSDFAPMTLFNSIPNAQFPTNVNRPKSI